MRRVIGIIVVLLMASALLSGCGKPSDMDQETYEQCNEAIEVGENCLSGKTSMSDACKKFDAIYEETEAYTPDNSAKHTLVSSAVLLMKVYSDTTFDTADKDKIQEQVDLLKRYL